MRHADEARGSEVLTDISPEGRLAGFTLAAVLVVSGIVVIAAGWDELWQRCGPSMEGCTTSAAAAALASIGSVAAIAGGIWVWLRISRRPVHPEGSSSFVLGIAALFALGLLLLAWRIPAFTCERGRFDEVLGLCMHPPTTSEPVRWSLLKLACVTLGLAGGVAIALWPRWVRLTAPLAVLAWAGGAGLFLSQTLLA
ncbi:MAG TPA: hypothetical protein VFR44_07535 [Actinomycetota bacterium]|nr:hypothetical protein [Actinomycetota bacterium]